MSHTQQRVTSRKAVYPSRYENNPIPILHRQHGTPVDLSTRGRRARPLSPIHTADLGKRESPTRAPPLDSPANRWPANASQTPKNKLQPVIRGRRADPDNRKTLPLLPHLLHEHGDYLSPQLSLSRWTLKPVDPRFACLLSGRCGRRCHSSTVQEGSWSAGMRSPFRSRRGKRAGGEGHFR